MSEKPFKWDSETILIADDDQYSYMFLEKVFKKTGAKTIYVQNGKDALDKLLSDKSISIAILDILMPKLTGIEVLNRIQQYRNDVIFIAYTADVIRINSEECLRAGFRACIQKPTLPYRILSILDEILVLREQEN